MMTFVPIFEPRIATSDGDASTFNPLEQSMLNLSFNDDTLSSPRWTTSKPPPTRATSNAKAFEEDEPLLLEPINVIAAAKLAKDLPYLRPRTVPQLPHLTASDLQHHPSSETVSIDDIQHSHTPESIFTDSEDSASIDSPLTPPVDLATDNDDGLRFHWPSLSFDEDDEPESLPSARPQSVPPAVVIVGDEEVEEQEFNGKYIPGVEIDISEPLDPWYVFECLDEDYPNIHHPRPSPPGERFRRILAFTTASAG